MSCNMLTVKEVDLIHIEYVPMRLEHVYEICPTGVCTCRICSSSFMCKCYTLNVFFFIYSMHKACMQALCTDILAERQREYMQSMCILPVRRRLKWSSEANRIQCISKGRGHTVSFCAGNCSRETERFHFFR